MNESYIISMDEDGINFPYVRLYDVEHVKLVIESFGAFISENAPFEQEVSFCFPVLKAKGKKTKSFFEHELTSYVIKQYPELRPVIFQYVQSIKTTVIGECDAPLGLFPMAVLAIYESQYLSHFENTLYLHKKAFEEDTDMDIVLSIEVFVSETRDVLKKRKWDTNVIDFLVAWIVWNGSIGEFCYSFSPKISAKSFNAFMKALQQKIKGKNWFEKYEILEILEAVFPNVDFMDLEERFEKCLKEGRTPDYEYLKNGYSEDVSVHPDDFDFPEEVVEVLERLAKKAKKDKSAIGAFEDFVSECDLNHPSSGWEEAEIMWSVISAWDWCPETVDLAVTCMLTPAQWGPNECVPFSKSMSPEMFDLFMKKLCDRVFHLHSRTGKKYSENYQLKKHDNFIENNFRFGFIMNLITAQFAQEEKHLADLLL